MRYDLEIIKSDILTQDGKNKLADIFYNIDYVDNIAIYNQLIVGSISKLADTSKLLDGYRSLVDIPRESFISRVAAVGDMDISKILIKRGSIIPFLKSGTCFFNNYKVRFSNNSVRYLMEYDNNLDRYFSVIPEDLLSGNITITTNSVSASGTVGNDKTFVYSDVENINVIAIDKSLLPLVYKRNTIFIAASEDTITEGIYSTLYGTVVKELVHKSNIVTGGNFATVSTIQNNQCWVDITNKKIYIKQNNKVYDLAHKFVFRTNNSDYKYLIEYDPYTLKRTVFTDAGKIQHSYILEDLIVDTDKSSLVILDKYPASAVNITGLQENISYSVFNDGIIKLKNNTGAAATINADISYQTFPVIAYERFAWEDAKNIRHIKIDFSPKAVGFTDGTVCLVCTEGANSNIPDKLTVRYANGEVLGQNGSKQVFAKLTTKSGIPLGNRQISLKIAPGAFGKVTWATSATDTVSGTTNLLGEFSALLLSTNSDQGFYVQKSLVGDVTGVSPDGTILRSGSENRIYLPFTANTTDPNNFLLYFVLSDDPMITQLKERNGLFGTITGIELDAPSPYDFYSKRGKIDSYFIQGRKIAYVGLSAESNGTSTYSVKSRFIKPAGIQSVSNNSMQRYFFLKRLYLYNVLLDSEENAHTAMYPSYSGAIYNDILTNMTDANFSYVIGENFQVASPTRWDQNWLLTENKFDYSKIEVENYTILNYNEIIPGINDTNVVGYFLRVREDSFYVPISASFTDTVYGIDLETTNSDLLLEVINFNEDQFTLSTSPGSLNSYIGPYSYLSISDYVSAVEGTNYTTYVCRKSGRIIDGSGNRCGNDITTNYLPFPSDTNLYCGNTTTTQCPYLDAQLINPFILY